ncbi:hypothetical protein ACHAPB_009250, partial [Verticillium nonalfalfae]
LHVRQRRVERPLPREPRPAARRQPLRQRRARPPRRRRQDDRHGAGAAGWHALCLPGAGARHAQYPQGVGDGRVQGRRLPEPLRPGQVLAARVAARRLPRRRRQVAALH